MSKRNNNNYNIKNGIFGQTSGTDELLRVQKNGVMYMLTDKQIEKRNNNAKKDRNRT